jgi:hypothetical protein
MELKKRAEVQEIVSASPVRAAEGLRPHEISALALIMANRSGPESGAPAHVLRGNMEKAGFTEVATGVAIALLRRKGFIESGTDEDYNGNPYEVCRLTEKGENWLIDHQDRLQLRIDQPPSDEKENSF